MGPFLLATFLSALLLFKVQPIIARYILPWYGGSPSLWTACMMFFQAALLLGYLYAHVLGQRVPEKKQPAVHVTLLAVSILLLPIGPPDAWVPTTGELQGLEILLLLALSVGAPFVLIAASGPLLQRWYAGVYPDRSPFRLYALSNLGSLAGLLTYPVLVEPRFTLTGQAVGWSIAYGVLAASFVACGYLYRRADPVDAPTGIAADAPVTTTDRLLWIALAACGSTMLLAITNQICQDVAVVPFLWILPLSLYLVSFIICFERDAWYARKLWWPLFAVALWFVVKLMLEEFTSETTALLDQVLIYSFALFTCCMICHGELARGRPPAGQLTRFYLHVALGGAVGGVFVNILAPAWFTGFWELHVALVATVVLAGASLARDADWLKSSKRQLGFAAVWSLPVMGLSALMIAQVQLGREDSIHVSRGFFGVLAVDDRDAGKRDHQRQLYHGKIRHGLQLMFPPLQVRPTAYYGIDSGVGAALRYHPRRGRPDLAEQSLDIGVVGMGAATLSAYGRKGDTLRYYEINPQVVDIATEYFRFLENSPAENTVVLGDARLSMQRELDESGPRQFDVLVLDAFSGDSVPVHLLTREAFDLYARHLAEDGILAVHITNQFVDLSPVVRDAASQLGMEIILIEDRGERSFEDTNDWALLTSNRAFVELRVIDNMRDPWTDWTTKTVHWTDDFSNMFELIIWRD